MSELTSNPLPSADDLNHVVQNPEDFPNTIIEDADAQAPQSPAEPAGTLPPSQSHAATITHEVTESNGHAGRGVTEAKPSISTTDVAEPPNPYNPTHRFTCRCPSCCKKAKAARGEEVATPQPKIAPEVAHKRAVVAATSRWDKEKLEQYDWENTPLEEAQLHLGDLRKELERGGKILQQRHSTRNFPDVPCAVCKQKIPNGKWMQQRTIRTDGIIQSIFLCSQFCINQYGRNPNNFPPPNFGPTGLPDPGLSEAAKADLAKRQGQPEPKEARLKGRDGLLS